ncbi:MAG: nucleotide exchange factor GrpE [Atribacterota bacterium]
MDNKQKNEKDKSMLKNNEEYRKMKKNELVDMLIDRDNELKEKQTKLEKFKRALIDMQENEKNFKDQLIRMQADFENYKKREEKKRREFMEYANKDLICQLLSVMDNLERAVSYSQNKEHQPETIREGIKGTLKEFRKILEKEGLTPIKAVGEKFDPYCHEAIMQVESDKYPEDTVMEEISKGYYLKSNVIRPSVVKVCKGKTDKNSDTGRDSSENSIDNNNKNNDNNND